MTKIVYTDQETFEEPIAAVSGKLSESEITALVGHDDWDYVSDDCVPTVQLNTQTKNIVAIASAVAAAIALLPMLILPVSAEWKSPWPTKWAEINNTGYLVPYFPGKRLVDGECYFIERGVDGSLQSEVPDVETGECSEG